MGLGGVTLRARGQTRKWHDARGGWYDVLEQREVTCGEEQLWWGRRLGVDPGGGGVSGDENVL